MGFDHLLNTGLVLDLGFSPTSVGEHMPKRPAHPSSSLKLEPSLTLTLSGETFEPPHKPPGSDRNQRKIADPRRDNHLCVQDSAASSLSNFSSVKRDREQESEEVEIGRAISSRISEERDDGSNGRKKLRLSKAQSAILEESFKEQSTLNPQQKQDLAKELKLQVRQVEVWFQNRRARTKLKQTEMDCEIMKKCCESLTDENRRLQKEIRALKMAQPLYVQLPAATLTLCPSCERISGAGGGGSDDAPKRTAAFAITPKPHFYSPFTNSSAAC